MASPSTPTVVSGSEFSPISMPPPHRSLSSSSSMEVVSASSAPHPCPTMADSVNYRLCPEHHFPSQYDDGIDVLKFLDTNLQVLPSNADMSKTFLCGDSAGGNIAHHVAVRVCLSRTDPVKLVKLVGMIAIEPFFGGMERTYSEIRLAKVPIVSVERTDWSWKAFLPEGDRDHWAINVSGTNTVELFPDTMVVMGGYHPLRDWQKYYEWLKRCGKEAVLSYYPSSCHAFYIFPELPEAWELIEEIERFVSQRSG